MERDFFGDQDIILNYDFDELNFICVYFKIIIHAPLIDRTCNFCADFGFLYSSKTVHHVEINFPEDNVTFLSTTDRNITSTKRIYTLIDNEGFWIGFKIFLDKHEISKIRKKCLLCEKTCEYDYSSLYCILCNPLSFYFKKINTHTCASLTFTSLLESYYLKSIILDKIYQNNKIQMYKDSHSSDPNILYKILLTLNQITSIENPIVQEIKMRYVHNFSALNIHDAKNIITTDDFFNPKNREDGEDQEEIQNYYLSPLEKWCLFRFQ